MEAAAAKERYWKLQEAGKTDQARADLARLAIIRKEREEKAKQRQVISTSTYLLICRRKLKPKPRRQRRNWKYQERGSDS